MNTTAFEGSKRSASAHLINCLTLIVAWHLHKWLSKFLVLNSDKTDGIYYVWPLNQNEVPLIGIIHSNPPNNGRLLNIARLLTRSTLQQSG
jgi:hypothetical protein